MTALTGDADDSCDDALDRWGFGGLQAEMSDDQPTRVEDRDLDLWFGVDLDLPIWMLHAMPCAVCGAPAKVATRRLNEQHRRFVCDKHWSAK